MEKGHFGDRVEACILKKGIITPQNAIVKSIWDVEHWRNGELLSKSSHHNVVTDEGLNSLLNIMFGGNGTDDDQIGNWYVGLIGTGSSPTSGSTYATPIFTEETHYDGTTARKAFVESTSTTKSTTNSASPASFTMSSSVDVIGAFLCGAATAGNIAVADDKGTAGAVLYCASTFTTKSVQDNDELNITITLGAGDDA